MQKLPEDTDESVAPVGPREFADDAIPLDGSSQFVDLAQRAGVRPARRRVDRLAPRLPEYPPRPSTVGGSDFRSPHADHTGGSGTTGEMKIPGVKDSEWLSKASGAS